MKPSKFFLMGTLLVALCAAVPAMAFVPIFTGDVENDFPDVPGNGVLIIVDPGNVTTPTPEIPYEITAGTSQSGWDIKDLRLAYDPTTDIMYVGINSFGIVGDADGNGNPDATNPGSIFIDVPNLEDAESVAVYFDLDMAGPFDKSTSWDFIVGVPNGFSIGGFLVATWLGPPPSFSPPNNFGTPMPAHLGIPPTNPSVAWPDFEFSIQNFSQIPATLDSILPTGFTDPQLNAFRVGAFMGSGSDGGIGEDDLYYHQIPSTIVTINSDLSAVLENSTVNLTVTEQNDSTGLRSQQDGPDDDLATPQDVLFSGVQVEVTQAGGPLPWSPLVAPPDSGDDGDDLLQSTETWVWGTVTPLTSNPITVDPTGFVARASGVDPAGFVHTFEEDPDEEDVVLVTPILPSTMLTIDSIPDPVLKGSTVNLTVRETNDGQEALTNVQVVVKQNGVELPWSPLVAPPDSGDDGDNILQPTETWVWDTGLTSNPIIDNPTEFEAIGSGDFDIYTVTWCDGPVIPEIICDDDERAVVQTHPYEPNIAVVKTVDCEETLPGYPVNYTICIQNTGDVPVFPTLVLDDKLGDLTGVFAAACTLPLEPFTECCLTFGPYIEEPSDDPNTNTVIFEAVDVFENVLGPVDANATVVLVDPNFTVTKTCLTDPVVEGQPAKFGIEICNTGDVDLSITTTEPTRPGPEPLPVGECIVFDVNVPVGPDVTEVCNDIVVSATIVRPGNVCIDGEPVPFTRDANDCCPVPGGGEGCTPGFWKNNGDKHGASAWCDLFSPSMPISSIFALNKPLVIRGNGKSTITNPTLLQALGANGGGVNAMIRHGIAAMLNACSDCVNYPMNDPFQIIIMIEDALNGVGPYTVDELHVMFAAANEAGCPINQQGVCVGVEVEPDFVE